MGTLPFLHEARWRLDFIQYPTQPQDITSGPCNVYKIKLLPRYLHYLTTTDADSAKKSEEAVLNRKVCKLYPGTHDNRTCWNENLLQELVSSPSLKTQLSHYLII